MHPGLGGATALQKGRHQQGGVEGAELGAEHLPLQGEVAPQGGIPAAHHQPVGHPRRLQGRFQGAADLPQPRRRRCRPEGAGVGQHEQQRRRMAQSRLQAGPIPAEQQRAAMHRLGSGGVVVNHDDLEWLQPDLLHGTIVT